MSFNLVQWDNSSHNKVSSLSSLSSCHNPNDNTMQHNLNTVVGLDMKMTVQTPPHHTNST